MLKSIKTLSAAAIVFALAVPAVAQDELTADSVVATVNGTDITLGHMLLIRANLPEQYQQLPDNVLWDGILDQLVQQQVLSDLNVGADNRRVVLTLENERRALLASEAIGEKASEDISEEDILAAYKTDYVDAERDMEFNASHILVDTEEDAAGLVAALDGGADFAELAKEKSTGPSGSSGGELGWFGPGAMVPEFQQAVEQLTVGEVSAPVKTQFGWHVIKLNESRAVEAPALETVRDAVVEKLRQGRVVDYIDGLVDQAEVSKLTADAVDNSVLSNFQLLEE